jgi:phospholipid/cholesterol/gamma-HCH transport system substrate-binding protein
MKNFGLDFVVGLFVIIGAAVLLYMSVSIGGASLSGSNSYQIIAKFESTSGLKEGAFVELAGVRVGEASSITLDPEAYESVVIITLDKSVLVPDDSIASIRTAGIIGDRFIKLTPGGSDLYLENGEELIETEPSISLEELISKYMFSNE